MPNNMAGNTQPLIFAISICPLGGWMWVLIFFCIPFGDGNNGLIDSLLSLYLFPTVSRRGRRQHNLLRSFGGNGGDNWQVRRQRLHRDSSCSCSQGPRPRHQGLRHERESGVKALKVPSERPRWRWTVLRSASYWTSARNDRLSLKLPSIYFPHKCTKCLYAYTQLSYEI